MSKADASRQVVIGHPGRQHSPEFARALYEAGLLFAYYTGQFVQQAEKCSSAYERLLPRAALRNAVPMFGNGLSRSLPAGLILGHLARRLPTTAVNTLGEYAGFVLFDRQLARRVATAAPAVVIGYEMACLETFLRAKSVGALCILDAAACHHTLQDLRIPPTTSANSRLGRVIRSRKDAEAAIADIIICPSELSAQSYRSAGFPADRICVNELGVSSSSIQNNQPERALEATRFAFIANDGLVKGSDFIETAVDRLDAAGVDAIFDIIGAARIARSSTDRIKVIHHGHLGRSEVDQLLACADCLLLPSRLESFGMVVLEAMAVGTPVIVSKFAGAAMVVEEGRTGWTFDGTLEEFCTRVRWVAEGGQDLPDTRSACRSAAQRYDWSAYRERAAEIVNRLLLTRECKRGVQ